MRRFSHHSLCVLAIASALIPPFAASGLAQGAASDIVVNMRAVEIADVAEQISRLTRRTLILDPNVRGTVNVTSAEPLTPQGVWDLFLSVLRVHGFAAVRSGKAWRIVPQAAAIKDAGAGSGGRASSQDLVTRMIRLRNVPAEAAVRVLRPLVAAFGTVEAVQNPNAVVVTDYADNVRRLERLARSLDGGGAGGIASIPLKNANAREVAAAIQSVMGDGAAMGPRIAADERSNIVVVRGEPGAIAEARRIAEVLDQSRGTALVTRMFRLRNSDAEAVTDVLRGIMGAPAQATNPVARSLAPRRPAGLGAAALGAAAAAGGVENGEAAVAAMQSPGAIGLDQGPTQAPRGFAMDDLTVQPAPELNAIVVRGTASAIAAIEPLINDLDVRRPQVMIEAAIVEITGDQAEALGIQLGLGAAAVNRADGGGTSFTALGLPLRSILSAIGAPAAAALLPDGLSGNIGIGDNFSVLVQALGQSTKANLLSTPSLTTLDNEPAEIVVGQNVPFRTGSFATDGNTVNPFTTIERQDVGITLRVVPRVHQGDVVRLEVQQEVSSLVNANVSGAADLITNRRSIQTTVLADHGETIVLGGLITDDRTTSKSQVPVLGSVPIVGELFKGRRERQEKRTLFVFLRPTILRDRASAAAATQAKYGRLREEEAGSSRERSLLLNRPQPRLTTELPGIY